MKTQSIPNYGVKFALNDFLDAVDSGTITNDDGTGYYATARVTTDIVVNCRDVRGDFAYVVWVSK